MVVLNLPTESPDDYVDAVAIYKRVDAYGYVLLSTVALGIPTYEDVDGKVGDEYHITFFSFSLGNLESDPSNIYRVLTPWEQGMGVILELQIDSETPDVDTVGIYRRRYQENNTVRVGTVPLGTRYFSDPDGQPGDEYSTTFIISSTLDESFPCVSIIADAGAGLVVVSGFFRDVRSIGVTQGPGSKDPLGAGPYLNIELVWPKRHITPTANGQTIARAYYEIPVGASGIWSVPLVPNDLILGTNSYYEFTFTDGEKYHKKIRTTNGSAQNFALLEDVDPLELR